LGNLQRFSERLKRAQLAIQFSGLKEGIIVHHDEADGLTSAALSKLALEKLGLETRLICLDKLYPEVLAELENGSRKVLVYSDMGSGHVDWLINHNGSRNLILALDHHDTTEVSDPLVFNLNPELDGFSGEKEASSSTVAYLFARTVDETLRVYSHLALIGSMEIPGSLQGLNSQAANEAESEQLARKTGTGDFKIKLEGRTLSRSRLATSLNVLGSVGYYDQGPQRGVEACIRGFDKTTLEFASTLEEKRKVANSKMLMQIRADGLGQKKQIQWFHAHDNYAGMSGKVVGSFCSYLRYQRQVNPAKYLLGIMNVPAEIPGWGKLPGPLCKVSGRAPQVLSKLIEKGERPALSRILPEACSLTEGFGDGHSVAASGVFPVGKEEEFLERIEKLAELGNL
jgi:single-stranded-DNA-specific exonuclease